MNFLPFKKILLWKCQVWSQFSSVFLSVFKWVLFKISKGHRTSVYFTYGINKLKTFYINFTKTFLLSSRRLWNNGKLLLKLQLFLYTVVLSEEEYAFLLPLEVSFSFTIYIISHIYLYSILVFKRHAFPKHYVIDGRLYRKKNEENQVRKLQSDIILKKEGNLKITSIFHRLGIWAL